MGRVTAIGLAMALAAAGCLRSDAVRCADDRLCPVDTVCDPVHDRCVFPDQLQSCVDRPDGDLCPIGGEDGGVCVDQVCLPAGCGDLLISSSEDCDGSSFRDGVTGCASVGFYQDGPITCRDDCTYDTSACTGGICGDGVRDPDEQCDRDDLGLADDCADLGFYDQRALTCNLLCRHDTAMCTGFCGDQFRNGDEECDGAPPTAGSCFEYGFDAGVLDCLFCAPDVDDCGHLGWRSVLSGVQGALDGIWGSGPTDVFAVGQSGLIRHWDGELWQVQASDSQPWLHGVWGTGPADVFAVGSSGVILHHDGASWSTQASPVATELRAIWGSGPADVWAVGAGGTILHHDGVAWAAVPSPTTQGLLSVWGSGPDDVYAVGGGGTIIHRTTGAWSVMASGTSLPLNSVWGRGRGEVFAVGDEGTILSHDGTLWSPQPSPTNVRLHAIIGAGDDLYAVGQGGTILHRDGAGWWLEQGPSDTLTAVWASGGDDVFAVGAVATAGVIHHRGGAAWARPVPTTAALTAAWGFAADDVWFGGNNHLVHFDGLAWTAQPNGGHSMLGMWGSSPVDLYGVGYSGTVRHFDGTTWATQAAGTTQILLDVWGSGPDDVFVVGTGGVIAHRSGGAWALQPSPTTLALHAISGTGPSDIVAVGDSGTILRYDGTLWTAQASPTTVGLIDVWAHQPDDIYAVGDGTILHFDGTAWSAETLPTADRLFGVWGLGPDDVYVTGEQGLVLHREGSRWARVRSPVTLDLHDGWGTPRSLFVVAGTLFDIPQVLRLERSVPWRCRATETACGDGGDDDCDGLVDDDDGDCTGDDGLRLSEIAQGAVDYIEIVNRGDAAANLAGISIEYRGGPACPAQRYAFAPDAIVAPGAVFRVVDVAVGMETRERHAGLDLCGVPTGGGWATLCAGPCDLVACENVLDHVALAGTAAPASPPPCATFTAAPLDVTAATAAHSATRVAFTGSGATGVVTDWAVAPLSRD